MQRCDFQRHCLLGGVIRPGQATLITSKGVAHLACQVSIIRQIERKRDTEDLTAEQRERLQRAIDYLEQMSIKPERTSTGSMRVPPDILLGNAYDRGGNGPEPALQSGGTVLDRPAQRHHPNINLN